ncbi:MAG: hypothetical protein AAB605_00395 [Patescibacteria group bacterium]
MAKTMTASGMTEGQIENVLDKLRASLRKHRSEFSSDVAQQVCGVENLGMELFAVVREHAERFSDMIIRCVQVNRARAPQDALKATGRNLYVNDAVVKTMPKGEGDEAEMHFFKLDRWTSDEDLKQEFDKRGFKAADPYSLAAVNEADPVFADTHPNGTHWKDASGKWCYAAFYRWHDPHHVHVHRHGHDWSGRWWFAGVRK